MVNINDKLLAKNAYPKWRKAVKEARDSIVIFSPYFDESIITLLNHAEIDDISVITDFDVEYLVRHPKQLIAIKKLIEQGYVAKTLPRLHAKILLVDGDSVSIGSQNFTRYAQKSKECTVYDITDVEESGFNSILQEWIRLADDIDEYLVDELIDALKEEQEAYVNLISQAEGKFIYLESLVDEIRKRERREKLDLLKNNAELSFSGGTIGLTLKTENRKWSDSYNTLVADKGFYLTEWFEYKEGGRYENHSYRRFNMYPAYFSDVDRMGFIRLGAKHITYVRSELQRAEKRIVNGYPLGIEVELSKPNEKSPLVKIVVDYEGIDVARLYFGFDGEVFYLENYVIGRLLNIIDKELVSELRINDVVGERTQEYLWSALKPFKYKRLGIEDKNMHKYCFYSYYEVSLAGKLNNPIFIIE